MASQRQWFFAICRIPSEHAVSSVGILSPLESFLQTFEMSYFITHVCVS